MAPSATPHCQKQAQTLWLAPTQLWQDGKYYEAARIPYVLF